MPFFVLEPLTSLIPIHDGNVSGKNEYHGGGDGEGVHIVTTTA